MKPNDRVDMTLRVDPFHLLDAVYKGLECTKKPTVKKAAKRHIMGQEPRMMNKTVTCAEASIPLDDRCAACKASWHVRIAISLLEGL